MFCSSCGTSVASNANFCHKCGSPLPSVDQDLIAQPTQAPLEPIRTAPVEVSESARVAPSSIRPIAPTKVRAAISIFLAVFLIGLFAAVLIPAFQGADSASNSGPGIFLGSIVAGWYFWTRLIHGNGYVGVLVGVAVSLFVLFLSGAIRGYVRGQPEYILEHTPMYAALKVNYPEVYEELRQDLLAASKDKNIDAKEVTAQILAKVMPVVFRALAVTSDEALLQFVNVKMQQFQEVAASNASDCVALMSGQLASADLETQMRITNTTSKATREAMQAAFIKVLNDADDQRDITLSDDVRFNALYEQLDSTLQATYGTSAYFLGDESLNQSPDVRCKAGLLLFKEMLNLPPDDRSFMLRNFFASE